VGPAAHAGALDALGALAPRVTDGTQLNFTQSHICLTFCWDVKHVPQPLLAA